MGIYDRDYIRDDQDPSARWTRLQRIGRGSPVTRVWSVTTWLIVLTVSVFVIDSLLPMRFVSLGGIWKPIGLDRLPATAAIEGDPQWQVLPVKNFHQEEMSDEHGSARVARYLVRPILERPGGTQVGWREVAPMHLLESWLHFSTQRGFLEVQFWRMIGFQFLHAHQTIWHILFNMVGLFFFGPMVEAHLGRKRFLAFYLLCGIFGALFYVLLNLGGMAASAYFGVDRIPGLLFHDPYTPLIGASAGVFGVIMAGAFLAPNARVLLFFILPMRLVTLAYGLVAIAIFTVLMEGTNAGGEAGHIGGAIAGFYFIRHPHHLHGFFDFLGRVDPTSHHYRGHRGTLSPSRSRDSERSNAAEIDRILDKIREQGLQSLTSDEKRLLSEASRDGRS